MQKAVDGQQNGAVAGWLVVFRGLNRQCQCAGAHDETIEGLGSAAVPKVPPRHTFHPAKAHLPTCKGRYFAPIPETQTLPRVDWHITVVQISAVLLHYVTHISYLILIIIINIYIYIFIAILSYHCRDANMKHSESPSAAKRPQRPQRMMRGVETWEAKRIQ